MGYRVVNAEEKAEAIRLVVEMKCSVPQACELTGVGLQLYAGGFCTGAENMQEVCSSLGPRIRI